MTQHPDGQAIAQELLSWIGLQVISCTTLQTLWAGYGHICAIRGRPRAAKTNGVCDATQSLILKLVSPPHGRKDEGHLRKVFSYEVEQHFYDHVAPTLGRLPLAQCLVSTSTFPHKAAAAGLQGVTASVLTDLRLDYPIAGGKRAVLTSTQVHSAVRWLAQFHGSYWETPRHDSQRLILPPLEESKRRSRSKSSTGGGLWLNGGYTYLATRRTEYNALARDSSSEWSQAFCQLVQGTSMSVAELAASFLTPSGRDFETYLHGDVKSENLFSTETGDQVALFDFQYAGLGLGVCDLAKLFTCSVPVEMLTDSTSEPKQLTMGSGERNLLRQYRQELMKREGCVPPTYDWVEFERHWETALIDWCRFQASWGFWGNTTWLQARVRSILQQGEWLQWIKSTKADAV